MPQKIPEDFIQEPLPEPAEKPSWYQTPLKYILALFLILLVILWVVPSYGIKQNPEPASIPALSELNLPRMEIPSLASPSSPDLRDYLQVTPQLKQIADQIVSLACPQSHPVCHAKALFYFVQKNFNYLPDPLAFEYYKTPQESFTAPVGDCDDASILLSSLLRAVGFPTRFVFVPRHVFVQVKIPQAVSAYKEEGGWINLDPTCQNCPFGEIHYSYSGSKKTYLE